MCTPPTRQWRRGGCQRSYFLGTESSAPANITKIKGDATVTPILLRYRIAVKIKRYLRIDRFAVFVVCIQADA